MQKAFTLKRVLLALVCLITVALNAQQDTAKKGIDLGQIHGNFQADFQYYNPDSLIGAPIVPEKIRSNGFMNLIYTRGNFTAGVRFESYLNVLQVLTPATVAQALPTALHLIVLMALKLPQVIFTNSLAPEWCCVLIGNLT